MPTTICSQNFVVHFMTVRHSFWSTRLCLHSNSMSFPALTWNLRLFPFLSGIFPLFAFFRTIPILITKQCLKEPQNLYAGRKRWNVARRPSSLTIVLAVLMSTPQTSYPLFFLAASENSTWHFLFCLLASLEQRHEQTPTASYKSKFNTNQYISENYVFFGRPW